MITENETLLAEDTDDKHKALVNECIISAFLYEPSIPQEVKDRILLEGTLKADDYKPKPQLSDGQSEAYLKKIETDTIRRENFFESIKEYARTGDRLTQFYLDAGKNYKEKYWDSFHELSGIKKTSKEKSITLIMGVIKAFLSRPYLRKYYLNPCAESVIKLATTSKKVFTTSDISFEYKGLNYTVSSPVEFTAESWEEFILETKFKVVVYSLYPSHIEDVVEISYALV